MGIHWVWFQCPQQSFLRSILWVDLVAAIGAHLEPLHYLRKRNHLIKIKFNELNNYFTWSKEKENKNRSPHGWMRGLQMSRFLNTNRPCHTVSTSLPDNWKNVIFCYDYQHTYRLVGSLLPWFILTPRCNSSTLLKGFTIFVTEFYKNVAIMVKYI